MYIESIIHFIALFFGFLSSLWFIKGTLSLNGKSITQLAGSYWDENPHVLNTLVAQRVEYILGALFLCGSFSLQLLVSLIPAKFLQRTVFSLENSFYLIADIIVATLLFSWALHVSLKRKTESQVELAKQK